MAELPRLSSEEGFAQADPGESRAASGSRPSTQVSAATGAAAPAAAPYRIVNGRWWTSQANAFCERCPWSYHGNTSVDAGGQATVVRNARRHVEEFGHPVRLERGQIRYVEVEGRVGER
jgi:hypothetical protein